MVKCAVLGCSSKQGISGVILHRFPPTNSPQCMEWNERCGSGTKNVVQNANNRVCNLHFGPNDYKTTPKGRHLLESAVPSIAIPPRPAYQVEIPFNRRISEAIYFIDVNGVMMRMKLKLNDTLTPTGTVLIAEKLGPTPIQQAVIFSTTNQVVNNQSPPNVKRRKMEDRLKRVSGDLKKHKEKKKENKKKYGEEINRLKQLQEVRISKYRAQQAVIKRKLMDAYDGKIQSLTKQSNTYHNALQKIFTRKQIDLLTSGKHHVKWTNEDIGRFITFRYKSNQYEFLRSQGFPFASTRTLQRFTSKIDFRPGLLLPIIHLLKNEFENAPEITRQCILSFDEMSLDGSYAYDAKEDKIYPPSTNINAYFVRGLHDAWKQMVAYELDDKFHPQNILDMISVLEVIGLRVRGMTCDLGGKNRGLLNKLGVQVRKIHGSEEEDRYRVESSFKNPVRPDDDVWVFPDVPHLLKLIRDNLFKHGFILEGGDLLTKADFEKLLEVDSAEMQSNYKLGAKHLDVKGLQKTTVSLAVQLFSNTTAALWRKVYPNKPKQADFIQICNDWFDVMNSRTIQEAQQGKAPFGLHYEQQLDVLNRMEETILNLRVGTSKSLFPFQRGILQSISSMRGLFNDLSGSSLRISYVLTHRLNQDLIENAFSVIRKTGAFNTKPSVVDAKQRFKLLCLSMGGNNLTTSAVQGEDTQPLLSARMMTSLLSVPTTDYPPTPEPILPVSYEAPTANVLTLQNVDVVLRSMRLELSCEYGGKEWVSGFVASKFGRKYPELVASMQEKDVMKKCSWVMTLNKGGLTIPSILWLNQCAILEKEFDDFHSIGGTYQLNLGTGVLKGFTSTLILKYRDFPAEPLTLFIRTKMFIRIKAANVKLKEQRREAYQNRWGRAMPEVEEDEEEEEEHISEEEGLQQFQDGLDENAMPENLRTMDWESLYRDYLHGTL